MSVLNNNQRTIITKGGSPKGAPKKPKVPKPRPTTDTITPRPKPSTNIEERW